MQTTDNKMFLDMQEHPEKYSDQQMEVMMDELDREPDVEAAWQRFKSEKIKEKSEKHKFLEPIDGKVVGKGKSSFSFFTYRKIAASFIGILLFTGIAFAAIHFVQRSGSAPAPSHDGGEKAGALITNNNDTIPSREEAEGAPIVFENVPLDTMLMEMADFYHFHVEFKREEARQLRFHFVWKPSESLDRVLERLNNFKAVNIEKSDTIIIVE